MTPRVYLYVNVGGANGPRGIDSEMIDNDGWRWKLSKLLPVIKDFRPDGVVVSRPWGDLPGNMRLDSYDSLRSEARRDKRLAKIASVPEFGKFCDAIHATLKAQGAPVPQVGVYMGGQLGPTPAMALTLTEYHAALTRAIGRFPAKTSYPIIDTLGAWPGALSGLVARMIIKRHGRCGYEARPALVSELDQDEPRLVGYSTGWLWWGFQGDPKLRPLATVKHEQMVQCEGGQVDYGDKARYVIPALQAGRSVVIDWSQVLVGRYGATAEGLRAEAGKS